MPLLRAADPPSGVIRNDRKSVRFEQFRADCLAAVGRVGRIEGFSFTFTEFNETGVLDAVCLSFGDRKDHPFAQIFVGPKDYFDIVPMGPRRPAMDFWDRRETRSRIDGHASVRFYGAGPERQR